MPKYFGFKAVGILLYKPKSKMLL